MGSATRRVIAYFTGWRTGANDTPKYLANDIPWTKLTHINYAFAHVDSQNKVSIGSQIETNAAIGMEWPGVPGAEMDPAFSYKGHFNLINKYKKQHPNVKTLISIGGWAESGGYFDDNGDRVASGGFYSMTTTASGGVNTSGINAFATSVVAFLRKYDFDGADIDYEYPTSMRDAGNPLDFSISNARKAGLNASYAVLLKVLREKLDAAGEADGTHYMLTIASPSSGYLLRGMEAMDPSKYLDYVNIMSYDLHGAWNQFVGPNAALFDNGQDAELKAWSAYGAQYKNIGYLNTDWAYHYFRGSMPAGRINIGVPFYTRGWKDVQGGTNGMWGTAAFPDQANCPKGTGGGNVNKCGNGATGINNLWHDKDENGAEMGAGSNPMWHAKNLEDGILGDYLASYELGNATLTGNYTRHYDSTMKTPWLWNSTSKVFLSTEDEDSITAKAQYVIDQGIGGIMFWELAGDYAYNSAKSQYEMGSTLVSLMASKFASASKYGNTRAEVTMPSEQIDVSVKLTGFALGDGNYPINPDLIITNNTNETLPGGTEITFDMATTTGNNMSDQTGAGLTLISDGSNPAGNNVGGIKNNFHRVKIVVPSFSSVASGAEWKIALNYYLPISMPSNWIVKVGDSSFALKQEHPGLPEGSIPTSGGGNGGGGGSSACSTDTSSINVYPNWPRNNWAGTPDHAIGGDQMIYQSNLYKAKYWTTAIPGANGDWELVCAISG